MELALSYVARRAEFHRSVAIAAHGDVFHWFSERANKHKFHVCVSFDLDFLFLNTPQDDRNKYDYDIRESQIPFLKPTGKGFSSVGCSPVISVEGSDGFGRLRPQHKGTLNSSALVGLLDHLCRLRHIERSEMRRISDALDVFRGL